nr:MAG: replication associated protein [Cressdnaviricota sp.]
MRKSQGSFAKYWVFTENEYPEAIEAFLWDDGKLPVPVTYICGQMEQATTGQLHLQGYVECSERVRLSTLKKVLSSTAHFEVRKGTQQEAIAYTKKKESAVADTWFHFGEPVAKVGAVSEMQQVKAMVLAGESDETIATNAFGTWIRYNKGIQMTRTLLVKPKRKGPCKIIVVHGKSGSGKTHYVDEMYDADGTAFWKDPGTKWWDGYNGEKTVIFDEFDGSWFSLGELLRLIDPLGTPLKVEIKGVYVPMLADTYVFTSQFLPEDWYKKVHMDRKVALKRRFSLLVTMNRIGVARIPESTYNPWPIDDGEGKGDEEVDVNEV